MAYIKHILIFFYNLFLRRNVKSCKISTRVNLGKKVKIAEKVEIDENSKIGKYTYIGQYSSITSAKIGNYCSIASFVKIGHGEHDLTLISTNSIFYKNSFDALTIKDCVIGNDVWIGTDAIILRGVRIGNGAVIGANSLVNKDVPDFAIAVGSPAKIIKMRFNKNKIQQIINSAWWDYDLFKAKEILYKLKNDKENS